MAEITLDHIREACDWAEKTGNSTKPLDGFKRSYRQDTWDCGTACCIWGVASILAGNGPAMSGPPQRWKTNLGRVVIAGLLSSASAKPKIIKEAIEKYADLREARL